MIYEHAILHITPGREGEFEAAFVIAEPLIASIPGFIGVDLSRSLEHPSDYLFLVRWARLEDHVDGFRGSPQYVEWKRLLHHFYEPMPDVGHFSPVTPG